ncbi:MAG TPA: LuxR C-terminal-related transcriptional regulator [Pseudonocardiaceae bacterium]|nr:LuxR C-terminal-related transcriptional regulator [Pseudonocardiaceae bacterium]
MKTVSAALRLGIAPGADAGWDEVFDALSSALPEVEAAQVEGWDPVRGGAKVLARRGYRQATSEELVHRLPFTRWGRQLFDSAGPLLMDDMPQHFRASPHYRRVLGPAGFEDGLSAALRCADGRRVGVLHLSASARSVFGEGTREFVAQLAPALARGVDPLRSARFDALFGPEWAAARLDRDGEVVPLPGREPMPLVRDGPIVELAREVARSLVCLWRHEGRWYRLALLRDGDQVIVAGMPYRDEFGLTVREVDVATGILAGMSNQAIADAFVVSRRTVETYVERLLAKLDCASRGEIAGIVARAGLFRPTSALVGRLTRGTGHLWW